MKEEDFLLLWKKHWIPSSFGKKQSFLDVNRDFLVNTINLDPVNICKDDISLFENFKKEYWLLNRLDNDTAWFLYFARNFETYRKFKLLQSQWKIYKLYIADVFGDYRKFWKSSIAYPIMHHKFLKEKMIVIKKSKDVSKWRWKMHFVETEVEFLYYDKEKNISTLLVYIKRWIRHQIRVHLASIWYPIVWDKLYSQDPKDYFLHLWSVWFLTNF